MKEMGYRKNPSIRRSDAVHSTVRLLENLEDYIKNEVRTGDLSPHEIHVWHVKKTNIRNGESLFSELTIVYGVQDTGAKSVAELTLFFSWLWDHITFNSEIIKW
uniref:Core-binding (CB) domain-containing protein n=1 Tax=Steinernema glaseri TaxID=37863 RepID=A0A1I7YV82_9BILA